MFDITQNWLPLEECCRQNLSCLFVGFLELNAQCSLGMLFCPLVGLNLFGFRIKVGGGVLHFQRLETSLLWFFFLCDGFHCLDSAMYKRTVRYFVVAVQ